MQKNEILYVTKEGLAKLKNELKELIEEKRPEVARRIQNAREMGDISENAEYAEAKEEQMVNETEIAKLESILSRAKVVVHEISETIRVGSVIVCKRSGISEEQFTIVGREEADPLKGNISHESPLGKAFLGHRKSEKILVLTPRGEIEYHIINII